MCAGAAAAKAANENAKRQYEYSMQKRERKHMQKLSSYGAAGVQYKKSIANIHRGLGASYDRAQVKINQEREKALRENQNALIKLMQTSKFGDLTASGASGRSISRMGVLEAGALGRFYAQKGYNLRNAQYAMNEGTKLSRLKAANAQEQEFAKVAFQPTTDVAPPQPVMQNVGMAFFGDALSFAGSVATIAGAISDRRLKRDIKKIGTSIKGHNIYKFKYLDEDKEYIGAMSDEVLKKEPSAVVLMDNGYYGIDYNKIDVEFKEVAA